VAGQTNVRERGGFHFHFKTRRKSSPNRRKKKTEYKEKKDKGRDTENKGTSERKEGCRSSGLKKAPKLGSGGLTNKLTEKRKKTSPQRHLKSKADMKNGRGLGGGRKTGQNKKDCLWGRPALDGAEAQGWEKLTTKRLR